MLSLTDATNFMETNLFMKDHPLYSRWRGMHGRCRITTHDSYPYYGGRGITVCERWNDFWLFVEDMGECPEGHTLDRKENDGNYEPSNCVWATSVAQQANTRPRVTSDTRLARSLNNSMRYISRVRNSFQVCKTIRKKKHQKCFPTLELAQDFRSLLEMECSMHTALGLTNSDLTL